MQRDVLKKLNMNSREEAVVFLKRLWSEQQTPCPKCGATLDFLHKKAKKSNCDWKCFSCDTIYRTIDILRELNEE